MITMDIFFYYYYFYTSFLNSVRSLLSLDRYFVSVSFFLLLFFFTRKIHKLILRHFFFFLATELIYGACYLPAWYSTLQIRYKRSIFPIDTQSWTRLRVLCKYNSNFHVTIEKIIRRGRLVKWFCACVVWLW